MSEIDNAPDLPRFVVVGDAAYRVMRRSVRWNPHRKCHEVSATFNDHIATFIEEADALNYTRTMNAAIGSAS